jgi:hypothetical protein
MHLFLLLCLPAVYGLLRAGASIRQVEGDWRYLTMGLSLSPGAILISWLAARIGVPLGPFALYLRTTLVDHAALHVYAVGAWLLFRGIRALEDEAGRRRWFDYLAYGIGLYAGLAVYVVLASWGRPTPETVVFLPLERLSTVLCTSVLLVLFFESYGIYRVLYGLAIVLLPFAFGLVSYLLEINRMFWAAASLAVLASATVVVWSRRESL